MLKLIFVGQGDGEMRMVMKRTGSGNVILGEKEAWLLPLGQRQTQDLEMVLVRRGHTPDIILTSPHPYARATASVLRVEFNAARCRVGDPIEVQALAKNLRLGVNTEVTRSIARAAGEAKTVICVVDAFKGHGVSVTRGGQAAVLEFDAATWVEIDKNSARAEHLAWLPG